MKVEINYRKKGSENKIQEIFDGDDIRRTIVGLSSVFIHFYNGSTISYYFYDYDGFSMETVNDRDKVLSEILR